MSTDTKEFRQQAGEAYEEWKYRVIFAKAKKKCSLSWDEISDMLNLGCRGDYLRKIAYGVKKYADFLDARKEDARESGRYDDELTELENKTFAMQREKMRMQDQKRELNKLLRDWARAEHIQEEIHKAVKNLAKMKPLNVKPHKPDGWETTEAALLLSDWHKGMVTDNRNNKFNDAVFQQRIEKLVEQTIEHGRRQKVGSLHVFCLGDLVNGLIHVTTRINNEENVVKQTMQVAETLSEIIGRLSEEFDKVNLYWSRGNHDRVTPDKKESLTKESFFDFIPWYLESRLEGIPNIDFVDSNLDDEVIHANIKGSEIFAVHGHRDKLDSVIQNLSLIYHIFPDYVFMGHYHHTEEKEIQGAEAIINGSLCGADDYAVSLRRTTKPSQKLIIFDENGRLCTYNLRL